MAETSTMLSLGTPLPPFRLTDAVSARIVDATELARGKKGLLVSFICNHCPYVKHIRSELVRVSHEALDQGFAVVAVNSNDEVAYPQDGPAAMKLLATEERWRFPFLFDADPGGRPRVPRRLHPRSLPLRRALRLAYRGQFDDSRPSLPRPVTGASLRERHHRRGRGNAALAGPAAERGLQHQVEARQGTGVARAVAATKEILEVAGREVAVINPDEALLPARRASPSSSWSATTWRSPRARCAACATGPWR